MSEPEQLSLLDLTLAASALGLPTPVVTWPETFDRNGRTFTKGKVIAAANGEVQCVEYNSGKQYLVVYDEA